MLAVGDGWGRLGGPSQTLEGVGEGVYVRKLREIPDMRAELILPSSSIFWVTDDDEVPSDVSSMKPQ